MGAASASDSSGQIILRFPRRGLVFCFRPAVAEAPRSCTLISRLLPISTLMYHCKRDGQVMFFFLPERTAPSAVPEAQSARAEPGELLLFVPEGEPVPGSREEWPKLLVAYGPQNELVYPLDQELLRRPANVIGRLEGDVGELAALGDDLWRRGVEPLEVVAEE